MKSQVLEKMTVLITTAFGLVAALARNDAIKELFVWPCDVENAGLLCSLSDWWPWVYSIAVTIIAVAVTIWLGKLAKIKK